MTRQAGEREREREGQAALLAVYRIDLAHDPAAPPPAGLDPTLAAVARRLARCPAGAAPDAAFVEDLARRLGLAPTAPAPADRAPAAPRPRWPVLHGAGRSRAKGAAS